MFLAPVLVLSAALLQTPAPAENSVAGSDANPAPAQAAVGDTPDDDESLTSEPARTALSTAALTVPWGLLGPLATGVSAAVCSMGCMGCAVQSLGTSNSAGTDSTGIWSTACLGCCQIGPGGLVGLAGTAMLVAALSVAPLLSPAVGAVPYLLLSKDRTSAIMRWAAASALSALTVVPAVAVALVLAGAHMVFAYMWLLGAMGTAPQPISEQTSPLLVLAISAAWTGLLWVTVSVVQAALPLALVGVLTAWDLPRAE